MSENEILDAVTREPLDELTVAIFDGVVRFAGCLALLSDANRRWLSRRLLETSRRHGNDDSRECERFLHDAAVLAAPDADVEPDEVLVEFSEGRRAMIAVTLGPDFDAARVRVETPVLTVDADPGDLPVAVRDALIERADMEIHDIRAIMDAVAQAADPDRPLTLGAMIRFLDELDPDAELDPGLSDPHPHGRPVQVVFQPGTLRSAADVLADARDAVGRIHDVDQGGRVLLTEMTPVYLPDVELTLERLKRLVVRGLPASVAGEDQRPAMSAGWIGRQVRAWLVDVAGPRWDNILAWINSQPTLEGHWISCIVPTARRCPPEWVDAVPDDDERAEWYRLGATLWCDVEAVVKLRAAGWKPEDVPFLYLGDGDMAADMVFARELSVEDARALYAHACQVGESAWNTELARDGWRGILGRLSAG